MAIMSSHCYGIMVLEFEAKTSLETDWREYETGTVTKSSNLPQNRNVF